MSNLKSKEALKTNLSNLVLTRGRATWLVTELHLPIHPHQHPRHRPMRPPLPPRAPIDGFGRPRRGGGAGGRRRRKLCRRQLCRLEMLLL